MMNHTLSIILMNIVISVVVYFFIAFTLIIIKGQRYAEKSADINQTFDELRIDTSEIPPLKANIARDGIELNYRYYSSESNVVLILIHGSGWHGRYFFRLASHIASANAAHVYTPDLRGHGEAPQRRGDIDYIDQLEDDLSDLTSLIRKEHPMAKLVVGGHSSGGGLALRFAGGPYGDSADAYLLLSHFLKYNAPTIRPNSGGWAHAYLPRIVGLSMLNNIGIRFMNYLEVIEFNMPAACRDGTETLTYSHRLNTGYAPRNFKKDLISIKGPMLLVTGTADESFDALAFPPIMADYKPDAEVVLLDGVTHFGVVVGLEVQDPVISFLGQLSR
jgi:non-heme chloroperoxidase